jgi:hypothetical protein
LTADARDRGCDRAGVLDAGVHEADVEALEVLHAPGVGELVEDDEIVAVLLEAHADEGRADEPRAAADQKPHQAVTLVAR